MIKQLLRAFNFEQCIFINWYAKRYPTSMCCSNNELTIREKLYRISKFKTYHCVFFWHLASQFLFEEDLHFLLKIIKKSAK